MDLLRTISETFWNRDVWLPPNVTWSDFKSNDKYVYTDDISLLVLTGSLVFLALRYIVEKYIWAPVGIYIGIKVKRVRRAPYNEVLEPVCNLKLSPKQISGLAKQLDWSERKVERWLRVRRSEHKPTLLTKFCESGWRAIFYMYSFTYGLYILWDKTWLWDITQCWVGYPLNQSLTSDVRWYYISSTAFYISLGISQFFDVKRKDFWQMFIHHVASVTLLSLSWVCNLYRVGTLVLVVLDLADILMECAKMLKYCNYQKICDAVFILFTLVWIATRVVLYPFWIIYSTSVTAPSMLPMFPAYYIFNSLLILLLVLQLIWTYYILRMCYNSILAGQMDGDVRSCSSEEELSDISGGTSNKTRNGGL